MPTLAVWKNVWFPSFGQMYQEVVMNRSPFLRVVNIFGTQLAVPMDTTCTCELSFVVHYNPVSLTNDIGIDLWVKTRLTSSVLSEEPLELMSMLTAWSVPSTVVTDKSEAVVDSERTRIEQRVGALIAHRVDKDRLAKMLSDDFVSEGLMSRKKIVQNYLPFAIL